MIGKKSSISLDNFSWSHRWFWMQILMVFFIILQTMSTCILSHYHSWDHNPCSWHASAGWLRKKQQCCSVVTTRTMCISITFNPESLKSSPLMSFHYRPTCCMIRWFLCDISCNLFISLTVMSGAIIAINRLIDSAPLEWIMPFSVCWNWTQGFFFLSIFFFF